MVVFRSVSGRLQMGWGGGMGVVPWYSESGGLGRRKHLQHTEPDKRHEVRESVGMLFPSTPLAIGSREEVSIADAFHMSGDILS